MRKVAVWFLLVIVVILSVATGVYIGQEITNPAINDNDAVCFQEVDKSVSVEHVGENSVMVSYHFSGLKAPTIVRVATYENSKVVQTKTTGVVQVSDGAYRTVKSNFTLTIVSSPRRIGNGLSRDVKWGFVDSPDINVLGACNTDEVKFSKSGDGVIFGLDSYLYFSEYNGVERVTRTSHNLADGRRFSIIVPPLANVDSETKRMGVQQVNTTASYFGEMKNCSQEKVDYLVLPRTFSITMGREVYSENQNIFVINNRDWRSSTSTWIHEYVHVNQCYSTSEDLEWFTEGSAQYLTKYIRYNTAKENIYMMPPETTLTNNTQYSSSVLSKPETWSSEFFEYERGEKVVFYLDYHLRQHNSSMFELIKWMNKEEHVTQSDFKEKLRRETNQTVVHTFEVYSTTTQKPNIKDRYYRILR